MIWGEAAHYFLFARRLFLLSNSGAPIYRLMQIIHKGTICILINTYSVCKHPIPERILEGLAPLACPLLGEGSRARGWELLQHSER